MYDLDIHHINNNILLLSFIFLKTNKKNNVEADSDKYVELFVLCDYIRITVCVAVSV